MNEEEKTLSKAIEKALELAESTGEFVLDQAPDILREFYLWHTSMHVFFIVLGALLICAGRYIPHLWVKKEAPSKDDDYLWNDAKFFSKWGPEEEVIAAWISFSFIGISGLLVGLTHTFLLIKILVSPKLYLIEYFL